MEENKFEDIESFDFKSPEDDLIGRSLELQDAGFNEDYVNEWMNHMNDIQEAAIEAQVESDGVTAGDDFERQYEILKKKSNEVFEEKPKKPKHFRKIFKKFKPKFQLRSARKYKLAGQEREVRKINFNDTLRLVSKLPSLANYVGYNTPEMLVDQITGQYRFTKTVMAILERVLGEENFDFENNRPSDFQLSVLEEIAYLLNVDEEELMSSDPDEILDAIEILIEVNQRFFLRLWNKSGPIKELYNLTSGRITNYIKKEKEKLKASSEEDSTQTKDN